MLVHVRACVRGACVHEGMWRQEAYQAQSAQLSNSSPELTCRCLSQQRDLQAADPCSQHSMLNLHGNACLAGPCTTKAHSAHPLQLRKPLTHADQAHCPGFPTLISACRDLIADSTLSLYRSTCSSRHSSSGASPMLGSLRHVLLSVAHVLLYC